jgi:hypothetical protein
MVDTEVSLPKTSLVLRYHSKCSVDASDLERTGSSVSYENRSRGKLTCFRIMISQSLIAFVSSISCAHMQRENSSSPRSADM